MLPTINSRIAAAPSADQHSPRAEGSACRTRRELSTDLEYMNKWSAGRLRKRKGSDAARMAMSPTATVPFRLK